ncbi:hypothetical protein EVAR_62841_1 [Eumeta japonica]|uniref:Uncharacterized protein n=1 Tax=Eumeta variegata TaxID=151549 RepID=A0A4C1ZF45_EUMVA|nr:hypothetical protein EVAR_62841_1 [Eumeta japonica]
MSDFQGLMMETEASQGQPEGKHRNSIMKQCIMAVFGLVEIILRCTLTMNDFQGLVMQLEGSENEAGSLETPSSDPENHSWWRVHLKRTLSSSNTTRIYYSVIEFLCLPSGSFIRSVQLYHIIV